MVVSTSFDGQGTELRDFLAFHLSKRTKMKYYFLSLSLLFLILSIIFFIINNINAFSIIFIMVSLIMLLLYPIEKGTMIRKALGNASKYRQEVLFREDGIYHNYIGKSVKYTYQDFVLVCDTKKYIYLYIDQNKALVVSKLSLSKSDLNNLYTLITTNIKKDIYRNYGNK